MLRPALAWKTPRHPDPGGRTKTRRELRTHLHHQNHTRIATLAVGYADGYPEQVSGQDAEVLIGGKRCPVLGRVTMDQILADMSAVPETAVGDEAVLIGSQGGEEILARELADKAGTISWDIFTGLGARVKKFHF